MSNFYFAKRAYSIAIIGPPASGKGTISKWLARDFDAVHISTGDLIRQRHLDASLNNGSLASDTLVTDLLTEKLRSVKGKFCLDGFPRRKTQAETLDKILKKESELEAVILLNLSDDVLLDRIADRWIHPASGRTYSYSFSPPKVKGVDDLTGEPLMQRQDDLLDSFKNRMFNYKSNLKPILEYYDERGIVHVFGGVNSTEIYLKIVEKFTFNLKFKSKSI